MAKPPERGPGKSDLEKRNTKQTARIPFSLAATGNGQNLMENSTKNQASMHADGTAPSSLPHSNSTLAAAIQAAQLGFSIVSVNPETKRPTAKWKEFQTRAKTPEEVAKLEILEAFAIVGGAVSGGLSPDSEPLYLTSIDFDVPGFFERYKIAVGDLLDGVSVQKTGGGCYQAIFRSPVEISNTQLAWAPNETEETGREIAIETRGEGGYFVVPPSLHPTGNRYQWVEGDLRSVPTISAARAQALLDAARRMDEAPYTRQQLEAQRKREQSATPRQRPDNSSGGVIGVFNEAHSIQEMLERNGYKRKGDRYARPGGTSPSVTILNGGSFHHSSNDPLQCDGHTQDAFSVYVECEHGGDYKSAVKSAAKELGLSHERASNPTSNNATRSNEIHESEQPQPEEFEVFNFAEIELLPRPKWLVRGLLVESTISVLSADGGSFKSFLALDLALSIATGTPFHGREVKRGAVVYVAAEGFYTVLDRAKVWSQVRGVPLPKNFHILRAPVNVSDARQVTKFAEQFRKFSPVFAVLDTLSQNAIGLNENANDEMARFMAGMAATGVATGAHIMAVHHNAKATGTFRGAGAIKNNVDTHISLDRPDEDDERVNVRCEKQRGRPFDAFELRGEEIETGDVDEFGDPITSLVFELTNREVAPKSAKAQRADETTRKLLALFDELTTETPDGVKVGTWAARAITSKENPKGICSSGTFFKRFKIFKGEDEGKSAPQIECYGVHCGSDLFRRCEVTPTTPTTPICSDWSEGHKPIPSYSNNSNNPLGVGVVGVEWSGAENGIIGTPKAQHQKRANKNAEAEFYPAPDVATEPDDDGAGVDEF